MFKHVNKPARKKDSLSLAMGESKFTDDYSFPDMLHVALLHSPHAYAKIKDLDDSAARAMDGVVEVYSYKNVPRRMYTTAGQGYPEPSAYDCVLFNDTMRFVGDQVAAVVAETLEIAREAVSKIKVEYEVLEPLLDYTKGMEKGAVQVHTEDDAKMIIPIPYDKSQNLAADIAADVGDFDEGMKKAKKSLELTTSCPISSHCALEPHAGVAYIDEMGRLAIIPTSQVPYHARRIVSKVIDVPLHKIRVIKPRLGGGFGGKQEILVEPIVALAAWQLKRPVKLVYTRKEVFASARTRHGQTNTCTVGYNPETGEMDAIKMLALENAGAYGSHAVTVLTNTATKVLPLVNHVPNIRFIGKGVYANVQVGGAYRGYGATQGYFTYTQVIDMLAEEAGMDPLDYYHKYGIKSGGTSEIFAKLGEGKEGGSAMTIDACGLDKALDMASEKFDWRKKREQYKDEKNSGKRVVRGVGMGCFMQGSAVPEIDMGAAYMKMNDDGSFNMLIGATDIGTGSDTILAQIAAEVLDLPIEKIIVRSSDTDLTPFDVGAYASSTTYLSGGAVKKCAEKIKEQVCYTGAELLGVKPEDVDVKKETVFVKSDESKSVPFSRIGEYSLYENNQYQIQATASHVVPNSPPPFTAHFTEIELDTWTGEIKVLNYVTATDCGTAINPQLAEGQVEGALVNGLTYALTEEYKHNDKGVLMNASFQKYKIWTARDLPQMTNMLVEGEYESGGPFGAKSISEVCINGPIPVIANAFYYATGKRLRKAPFTREYVLSVLEDREDTTL